MSIAMTRAASSTGSRNVRIWNGSAWEARGTVTGYFVEWYSDGTSGSTLDAAAPAPTGGLDGDVWYAAA